MCAHPRSKDKETMSNYKAHPTVTRALAACAMLAPILSLAQEKPAAWTSFGPNYVGVSSPIVSDPRGSGIIFIASGGGGIRKSTDNGISWSAINTGLTDLHVGWLAMDAESPDIVYAATFFGGAFKTVDGGATWQSLTGVGLASANCLAADPQRPRIVYSGSLQGAISKTSDGGATWSTVFNVPVSTSFNVITNIAFDPVNSDILYASTLGQGAFKSLDAGRNWFPLSALPPNTIWSIAVDPNNGQTLYAGTNAEGVWISAYAGANWQHMDGLDATVIYTITVDPSDPHTVYAGTGDGGVWQSVGDDLTWNPTGLSAGMALAVSIDSSGALYAGMGLASVLVSRDSGMTWDDLDPGLRSSQGYDIVVSIDPTDHHKLFLSRDSSGLTLSEDGGETWTPAGKGFVDYDARQVTFDPTNSQRIYSGSTYAGGLFKSEDGGLTWARRQFGAATVFVWTIGVDPASPNIVYAGTGNDGMFKSIDFGDTWMPVSGLTNQVRAITVDAYGKGRVFAGTNNAFFLSEDGGGTWTQILNQGAWFITIDPNAPLNLYAASRANGISRSRDGGKTWEAINTGLGSLTMSQFAKVIIDPTNPQVLYVGSSTAGRGGIFKSRDGGDHWFAVNSGLENLTVNGLTMDPADPAVLYVSSRTGTYKTVTGGEPIQ